MSPGSHPAQRSRGARQLRRALVLTQEARSSAEYDVWTPQRLFSSSGLQTKSKKSKSASLGEADVLHQLDVVIAGVVERIVEFSCVEGMA